MLFQHVGDKPYAKGDKRFVSNENDAKHLLSCGLIAEIEKSKPEKPKPKSKK